MGYCLLTLLLFLLQVLTLCVFMCRILSGNPLHCSCDNMWIKLWLGEEADTQELQCIEDGGGRKLLSRLTLPKCGENTRPPSRMHIHTHTQAKKLEKTFIRCTTVQMVEASGGKVILMVSYANIFPTLCFDCQCFYVFYMCLTHVFLCTVTVSVYSMQDVLSAFCGLSGKLWVMIDWRKWNLLWTPMRITSTKSKIHALTTTTEAINNIKRTHC